MKYPFFLSALVALFFTACGEAPIEWQEVTTEGIPKTITLTDGSTIHLNANSYLKYPKEFTQSRRVVEMEGEAFFEVTKGEKKFVVNTNYETVTVIGTSFNINTNETPTATFVNVAEGAVELAPKSGGAKISLAPTIKGFFDREKEKLGRVQKSTGNDMFWHTKTLQFKKTYLARVLEEINREMKVEISLTNPALMRCEFTATFENATMEAIMAEFEKQFGVETFKEDEVYYSLINGSCPGK